MIGRSSCPWLSILAAVLAAPLGAQELPDDEATPELTARVTVLEEYDSNINFADGTAIPKRDDLVTQLVPRIAYHHPYRDHRLSLELDGDYRKGADTDLSDLNLSGLARADLKFTGGFGLGIFDTYTRTSFDQAIFDEPGTSRSDSNQVGGSVSYARGERFRLDGHAEYLAQSFSSQSTGDRTVGGAGGRFSTPIARRVVAYGDYQFTEQDSPTRIERRYDDHRGVGGVRVEGPARVVLFAEAGRQRIRFDDPLQLDFSGTVGNAGVEVRLSEHASGRASVGRDGYRETVFSAGFDYQFEEEHQLHVLVNRATRSSFAVAAASSIYQGTVLHLSASTRIRRKLTLGADGSYFLYRPTGDLPFLDSDTGYLRGTLLYTVREWLRLGGHYQYAQRTSDNPAGEYADRRAGGSVQFLF